MAELLGYLLTIPIAVATYYITRHQARVDEVRAIKRDFLTRLMAHRYDLCGDPFSDAINGAAVAFDSSPKVKAVLRVFHSQVVAGAYAEPTLLELLRAMAEDLDLNLGDLDDEFLLTPFNTRPSSRHGRPSPPSQPSGG